MSRSSFLSTNHSAFSILGLVLLLLFTCFLIMRLCASSNADLTVLRALSRSVPKLDTLILVKSMIKNHSFVNPYSASRSRFRSDGRSNSAPEVSFYNDRYSLSNNLKLVSGDAN